jgi:hypothetical protein
MRVFMALVPITLFVSACGSQDEPAKGTDVNIDATSKDGTNISITADGESGNVGVNIPGLDAKVRLPKTLLNSADFDIDGVKIYPGSTIQSMNVSAQEKTGEKGSTEVRVTFDAPADKAKVGKWFRDEFAKNNVQVAGDDATLSGKSKDGSPFTITLSEPVAGKTTGAISLRD